MIIQTEALTKFYGGKVGCKDISISVREGEIFALLGPNGAGKSTLIKMLMGLLFPTGGTGCILNEPIGNVKVRRKIGYLPENFRYQEWMTGVDLLSFHASLYKLDKKTARTKIQEVLEVVKLKGHEQYKIGTYSKGMQQRVGIASCLLCDPELIFLDEPTSALDPIGRKEVREILMRLKESGKTIFLNSHLLSEVEMLCSSAAIINKGSVLLQGSMKDILQDKTMLHLKVGGINQGLIDKLKCYDSELVIEGENITLQLKEQELIPVIAKEIINSGSSIYEIMPQKESLEDIFVRLIEGEKHE